KVYEAIRDAKDWQNPYLVIQADGVLVTAGGSTKKVAVGDLEAALASLPPSAWPYGAVIAAQEQSIRAGDGSDDAPIAANKARVTTILGGLGLTVSWWPSA